MVVLELIKAYPAAVKTKDARGMIQKIVSKI
jgi:hypothetical protein